MKNLIFAFVVLLSSCDSSQRKSTLPKHFTKFEMESLIIDKGVEYHLIRDNLYYDAQGNLYLKSTDVSSADSRDPEVNWKNTKIRWLSNMFCDTIQSSEGMGDWVELRSVIDTATFRLKEKDAKQGADWYVDKKHLYFHKWMADGGTISLRENKH